MIAWIVNLLGILLIGIIITWFWLYKPSKHSVKIKEMIDIKVKDGVYQPAYIEANLNQPFTLRFIREDATPCAEMVVFNSLNISQQLPLHQPTDVQLTIKKPGEYDFTCQMGMYRGKIIVKPSTVEGTDGE